MTVTVVSVTDGPTKIIYSVKGDVMATNVSSAITGVLDYVKANGEKAKNSAWGKFSGESGLVTRLNIIGHGSDKGFNLGGDFITVDKLARFATDLKKLTTVLDSEGFVHLQGCNVGDNTDLVSRLAKLLGVTVYAGRGYHQGMLNFNTSDYLRCEPSGSYSTQTFGP